MSSAYSIGGGLLLFTLYMIGVDTPWLVAFAVAGLGLTFNSMVHARTSADTAFASIDVYLKKRFDLIPNLVDTVSRYAEHEEAVFAQVTRLRAEGMAGDVSPDRAAAMDKEMGQALSRIFATAEAYPELKANQNFQQLQATLHEVEEQISAARRTYNMAIKVYNDAVGMFPTNIIALMMSMSPRAYFELPQGQEEAPSVGDRFRSNRAS